LVGDRVQLQQVLINLVLNAASAIDAGESGPRTITVQAAQRDKDIKVSVRDTGVGFAKDLNIERIFDAFFTTKPDGIGMGLAITKSIVEAHDGRVWADRNDDRGATFTFTIPCESGADHA
jgi:signal transduction histidine kinase